MLRSALMTVMVNAARKGARALLRDFGEIENLQVSRKGPGDFVTATDRKVEKTLREELEKARSGYSFLMEESGAIEGTDKTHRWIIDPIDGTTNFLHGLPHFAISIALEREGQLVAGLIYNPVTDEMFWSEKGKGAFLNEKRIRVAGRRDLEDSVITMGIPHLGRGDQVRHLCEMEHIMPHVAGLRRFGSAALDLAYVASGRCDAFYEHGLSPWDIAAGILIVREAGGFVTNAEGGKDIFGTGSIVAGNEKIHGAILEKIRTASKALGKK